MILTVTANAAVDKTLTVPNLQLGHRHRAQQGIVIPGGKGVNVARALTAAQLDAAARAALDPNKFVWVVVGDASKVKPQLDGLGLPVEVVPAKAAN